MTVKTFPSKSAGPHYPIRPLKDAILRLVPGNPREAIPALKWFIPPLTSTHIRATVGESTATISLPANQPIPPHFFDFVLPQTYLTITLLAPIPVARAIFLSTDFDDRKGIISRPLIDGEGIPIAQLTLDYMVITPGPEITHPRLPKHVPRLTGHRGMGSSGPAAPWRQLENVPESFLSAALPDWPVKTVELDVQLTRDGKTVVYHDWFYRPGGERDKAKKKSPVKVPIYNLTFNEFDELFRKQHKSKQTTEGNGNVRSLAARRPDVGLDAFDIKIWTLQELCEALPEEIGMLVEIKYPAPDVQDDQMIPYPEKNVYVDTVLRDLFNVERNQRRQISFLSFDADICTLLALKQDVYSVYLSHCETMDQPCDMYDPRTIDLDEGLKYALSQKFDGMMLLNELVFARPEAVKRVTEAGLPIITYGGRNTDARYVQNQFDVGVKGVIADDIDKLVETLGKM